jgi:hypothetical protein
MSVVPYWWSDDENYSSSDSEEEEEEDVYCPRELDYWDLEEYLEQRGPPPVIEYAATIGVFALRECVVMPENKKIEFVVDPISVHGWNDYWQGRPVSVYGKFSAEDWDAIGEYCFGLCERIRDVAPTLRRVRSCMIYILKYGKFK